MDRLKYNKLLIDRLVRLVEGYPDERFSQILFNHGYVIDMENSVVDGLAGWEDEFYLESIDLLKRVKKI